MADHRKIVSEIKATLDAGTLRISSARASFGDSVLTLGGAIQLGVLPLSADGVSGELVFNSTVGDLSQWHPRPGVLLRGQAHASLEAKFHEGLLELKQRVIGSEIEAAFGSHSIKSKAFSAEGTLHFVLKELLAHGLLEGAKAYEKRSGASANTLALTHSEATFRSPKFQIKADAASCDFFLSHDAIRDRNWL